MALRRSHKGLPPAPGSIFIRKELMDLSTPRMRTCIATRTRRPDVELLRVVIDPDDDARRRVVADPARSLPGRGAWITPDLAALELAERHRAFGRALRTSAPVDTSELRAFLESRVTASGEG